MLRIHWLHQLSQRWFPQHGTARRRRTRHISAATRRFVKPTMEVLEDRTLLSAPISTTSDLVNAIVSANTAGGATTITLAAGTTFNFTSANNSTNGANALPVITGNITIIGNGDTIERAGTNPFRLIDVASGASLTLQNLTLQGGLAQGSGTSAEGGAIYNQGNLTLNGTTIKGNLAQGQSGGPGANGGNAEGGGIYSLGGNVVLSNAIIGNNQSIGGTGGDGKNGSLGVSLSFSTSAAESDGTVKVQIDAHFNTGPEGSQNGGVGGEGQGGGLDINGGSLSITNSTISSNSSIGGKGGQGGDGSDELGLDFELSPSDGSGDPNAGSELINFATKIGQEEEAAGLGGQGGLGGNAQGGGCYIANCNFSVSSSTIEGNSAMGGTGGGGGKGGDRISGNPFADVSDASVLSGFAKTLLSQTNQAGHGGDGGIGGEADGGEIYTNNGIVSIDKLNLFQENSPSVGGTGGNGGNGGSAVNLNELIGIGVLTAKTLGGSGGKGGNGGDVQGAGIYSSAGSLTLTDSSGIYYSVSGDGTGGIGGVGGTAGSSALGFFAIFSLPSPPQDGAGGNGGNVRGCSIYNADNGVIKVTNGDIYGIAQGGNGGAGIDSEIIGSNAGNGGQALGGSVYNDGGEVSISASLLESSASGGDGGQGGNGYIEGEQQFTHSGGGQGGSGGAGGEAAGGGIYNTSSGVVIISGGSNIEGNIYAGTGGIGGFGGHGVDAPPGGAGGPGGRGGNGGSGAAAIGGGIFNSNGTILIAGGSSDSEPMIEGSSNGGFGGSGGEGGDGGSADSGLNGNGGAGGQGGVGGEALGGGIYNDTGSITITNTDLQGVGDGGGKGGNSGSAGSGGNFGRTISGAAGSAPDGAAGGLAAGGAVYNANGAVTMTASQITGASAYGGDGGGGGAGAFGAPPSNGGDGGAGGDALGGAIYSAGGTLNVEQSLLDSNNANINVANGGDGGITFATGTVGGRGGAGGKGQGGAIAIVGGSALLANSTFENNQASGASGGTGGGPDGHSGKNGTGGAGGDGLGGAVSLSGGTLFITNCTFSGYLNSQANAPEYGASGGGGGQGGGGSGKTGGNGGQGGNGFGGAIYVSAGTLDFSSSTLGDLQAQQGTGGKGGVVSGSGGTSGSAGANGSGLGGGIDVASGATAKVFNSLIASNTASNAANTDVNGVFTSLGHNLIGNASGATGFGATGDLLGTSANPINPVLGTLADNGGGTSDVQFPTLALQAGSPAINAPNLPSVPNVPTTDERGVPRDSQPDIGSYEYSSTNNSSIGANVPLLQAPGLQTAYANAATTFNLGSFGDDFSESPWSVSVNWGDNSTPTTFTATTTGGLGTQRHIYAAPGVYMVTETVTNQQGAVGTGYFMVEVGSVTLTPAATSITAGTSTNLTVSVLDAFGRPVTNYTGTIQFSSGDPNAAFSDDASGNLLSNNSYTFTDADQGTHVFTVSLQKAGAQTLTATDITGLLAGQTTITVTPTDPASIAATTGDHQVAVPGSAFATALQATVIDAYGNDVPGVSVTFTAPSSGASGTFAGGATSVTETTDNQGVATAPDFTANNSAGSYTVTAIVSGVSNPASFNLVNDTPISLSTTSVPDSTEGMAYNQTVTASGGTGTLTLAYKITSGTLPTGLAFTTGAGSLTVSGTPTASGTIRFDVTVTDPIGASTTQSYTLTINLPVSLSASSVPASTQGVAYNQTLTASGGTGSVTVTYKVTSGTLPSGLAITTSAGSLTVAGTPTASGTVSFDVTAVDSVGASTTQSYTLTINPPVSLSTTSVPAGTVGAAYGQTIAASGGTGSIVVVYTVASGAMPAGLNFTVTTNHLTIAGTPTAGGTVSFLVTATDSVGAKATHELTLTVSEPPPAPPSPPPSPPAPPFLNTPPLLAFFDSLLGGVETVNGNGTETITDRFFGIPLLVSTFDSSGNLVSVTLFGINVTFLFG